MTRLISMSIWGDKPMYWEGAFANADLARSIYPGWRLRFYTDAENSLTERLKDRAAEIRVEKNLGGWHGTYWRFLAASEPGIEAVIFRDADSRLNAREAAAVAEWLNSGKVAHIMRDHPFHYRWPIMAGMWGIKGGVIRDMAFRIATWGDWSKKFNDQRFLRQKIWPRIANDCLQHSSGPSPWGGQSFPAHEPCESDFVGQAFYETGSKVRTISG